MYEAIYEFRINPGSLDTLAKHWKELSTYMINQPGGAVSSSLYFCSATETCIIHSRWPSLRIKKANWPLPPEAPQQLHESAKIMQSLYKSPVSVSNYSYKALQAYLEDRNAKLCAENISPKRNVVIYNDSGADPDGVYHTFRSLSETMDLGSCRILVVDGKYFTQTNWESNTRLVVMPGGRARPYYDVLGAKWHLQEVKPGQMRRIKEIGEGNKRIINFVSEGGSYLGICAGGYYGAKETVFELGGDLEVLDEGLSLAPCVARGPAYGLNQFQYNSEAGARAAKVNGQLSLIDREVYFNGGCAYEPQDSEINPMNILLRYADLPQNPAAVIQVPFKKGSVILSGVHFEFVSDSSVVNTEIAETLSQERPHNLEVFAQIINLLGVPLNDEMVQKLSYLQPQTEFERTHFEVTPSTQDYLKDHASELLQNTNQVVVTANEQTKGRGTKNRKWASPPHVNIYATFGIKLPNDFELYFDLAKSPAVMEIMALAVAKTLEDFGLKPQIKWRNDVLLNGKKVCGILCEVTPMNRGLAGLIGIGLNVNMAKEVCDTLDQPVTSMAIELGRELNKEAVFNRLAYYVSHYTNLYLKNGFSSCISELNQRLAFIGKTIKIIEELTGNTVEGVCVGVDEIGQLKLKLANDQIRLIRWGTIVKEERNINVGTLFANQASLKASQLNSNVLYSALTLTALASIGVYGWARRRKQPPVSQEKQPQAELPLNSETKLETSPYVRDKRTNQLPNKSQEVGLKKFSTICNKQETPEKNLFYRSSHTYFNYRERGSLLRNHALLRSRILPRRPQELKQIKTLIQYMLMRK
ncbi:MAG: hypothetical protein K0S27_479 [Gammaproteobacteria bacterium]|jgi:biotin-[acetyl-CoA-carboxylase] ligase BirA-like protein|nr:hypothetical protein [Gammaproteobacteria bacterium]